MVPDGRNGRTDGRRQNYIPPTSSGDNKQRIKGLAQGHNAIAPVRLGQAN